MSTQSQQVSKCACDECGRDCSEEESRRQWLSWRDSGFCCECADGTFSQLQSELSGLIRIGH